MDTSLLQIPSDYLTKDDVANELWGHYSDPKMEHFQLDLSAFWTYYKNECAHALHDAGRHVSARTHRDILEVARQLKADTHRHEIKKCLRPKLAELHDNEDELLENTIDLTASLLLMCDCGSSLSHGFSGRTELRWEEGQSIRQFLADYFGQHSMLISEKVKLEKSFISHNLERIAGVEIIWTDNLADHLRLIDDDTKVLVFHHASFLERCQGSSETLLPHGLAAETLQTLALLFPSSHRSTKRWLSKLTSVDPRVMQCGRLKTDLRQIERFYFWRDRLVLLKQVYDEAQPSNLSQWWHDRRNGVQWYTFWVAVLVLILTVVLGLIQCVEGALQVYLSYQALSGN